MRFHVSFTRGQWKDLDFRMQHHYSDRRGCPLLYLSLRKWWFFRIEHPKDMGFQKAEWNRPFNYRYKKISFSSKIRLPNCPRRNSQARPTSKVLCENSFRLKPFSSEIGWETEWKRVEAARIHDKLVPLCYTVIFAAAIKTWEDVSCFSNQDDVDQSS